MYMGRALDSDEKEICPESLLSRFISKTANIDLRQCSEEDYYKDMEIAMLRVDVVEEREAIVVRFLSGLTSDR